MNQILLIILGWLLGTLSPGVVEAISRNKRKAEVLRCVRAELHDLRYKAALVAHQLRVKTGTLARESLATSKRLIMHEGLPGDDGVASAAMRAALEQLGDDAYIANHNREGPKKPGFWPVPYEAPFLNVSLSHIALFTPTMQSALLRVRSELHLFNHQVEFIKLLTERTFSLTGDNYQINQGNLNGATTTLITRADFLIQAIDALGD